MLRGKLLVLNLAVIVFEAIIVDALFTMSRASFCQLLRRSVLNHTIISISFTSPSGWCWGNRSPSCLPTCSFSMMGYWGIWAFTIYTRRYTRYLTGFWKHRKPIPFFPNHIFQHISMIISIVRDGEECLLWRCTPSWGRKGMWGWWICESREGNQQLAMIKIFYCSELRFYLWHFLLFAEYICALGSPKTNLEANLRYIQ